MKKVLKWLEERKDEIMYGVIALLIALLIMAICFSILFIGISDDLVKEVQIRNGEIEQLKYERNYYYGLYDSVIQSYEDAIPKQQYIDDIEYLESVILQLRQACGEECEGI